MEAVAKLMNYPTGPRKMRLLADVIRGMQVEKALAILEHHPQHNAVPLAKLLKSAINNWEQKNEGGNAADANLVVKTIFVDGASVLKRMRPAPQGRGYRVRKRSNHVTLAVDSNSENGTSGKGQGTRHKARLTGSSGRAQEEKAQDSKVEGATESAKS